MFGHTLILHQLSDSFELWQLFFIEKELRTNYLVRQPHMIKNYAHAHKEKILLRNCARRETKEMLEK